MRFILGDAVACMLHFILILVLTHSRAHITWRRRKKNHLILYANIWIYMQDKHIGHIMLVYLVWLLHAAHFVLASQKFIHYIFYVCQLLSFNIKFIDTHSCGTFQMFWFFHEFVVFWFDCFYLAVNLLQRQWRDEKRMMKKKWKERERKTIWKSEENELKI